MSQWRRIALEDVPSCKSVISTAKNPVEMWSGLFDALLKAYQDSETSKAQIEEIYRFALACESNKRTKYLANDAWAFFHLAVGLFFRGNQFLKEDLPRRISSREIIDWARGIGLSDEEILGKLKHL